MCDQGSGAHRPCLHRAKCTDQPGIEPGDSPVGNTILARAAGSARPTAPARKGWSWGAPGLRCYFRDAMRVRRIRKLLTYALDCRFDMEAGR